MREQLRKLYVTLVAPAAVLFVVLFIVQRLRPTDTHGIVALYPAVGLVLFLLAIVLGVVSPLLLRTWFVYTNREAKSISETELLIFERWTLYVSLVTPYLAVVAAFLELPTLFFTGTVLAAFYALYYFYPSEKRIRFEKRIFRVK